MGRPRNTPETFLAQVNRTETCWVYTGGRNRSGYGKLAINQVDWYAHRYSWTLVHGPIPAGLDVLHTCPGGDNKACVNPAHLRLGTEVDNGRDRAERGQMPRGEQNSAAVLTADDVQAIRAMLAAGESGGSCARLFRVGKSTIYRIRDKLTWK